MPLNTKSSLSLALLVTSAYLLISTCGVDHQEGVNADAETSAETSQSMDSASGQLEQGGTDGLGGAEPVDMAAAGSASWKPEAPTSGPTARPAASAPRQAASPNPLPSESPAPPPAKPQPIPLTVVAGETIDIEFRQTLSSHTSQPGQPFRARVTEAVRVGERVAISAGATIHGTVTEAEPAKKIGGRARLSLQFESLSLPSGATYPIGAMFSQAGRSQNAKDAAIIGGATLGGAVLGKQVGGDTGTIIGAVAGGIGGAFAAKKTKGKPVEIPAGTVMILELTQPVTIDVLP